MVFRATVPFAPKVSLALSRSHFVSSGLPPGLCPVATVAALILLAGLLLCGLLSTEEPAVGHYRDHIPNSFAVCLVRAEYTIERQDYYHVYVRTFYE